MQCMLKDRQANEPCSHTECWDAAYRMLPVTHLHNLQMIKHTCFTDAVHVHYNIIIMASLDNPLYSLCWIPPHMEPHAMTDFTPLPGACALCVGIDNVEPHATLTKPREVCSRIQILLIQAPEWMMTNCVAFCPVTHRE